MAIALVLVVSCAQDPHKLVVTKENRAGVVRKVERSKKVTAQEKQLFASFIEHEDKKLRSSEGKTVAQVIDEERKIEEGMTKAVASMEDALQTMQKLFGTAGAQQDARKLVLKVLALRGEAPTSAFAGVDVDYAVENRFDKNIASFEGRLLLSDTQGRQITEISIAESEILPAGETRNRTRHLSDLLHPSLREKLDAASNVNCKWVPVRVIFGDGTQLAAAVSAGGR